MPVVPCRLGYHGHYARRRYSTGGLPLCTTCGAPPANEYQTRPSTPVIIFHLRGPVSLEREDVHERRMIWTRLTVLHPNARSNTHRDLH